MKGTPGMSRREGFLPFRGYRVWYRIVGEEDALGKLPLLCLHGGPGVPHDYLEALETVVASGRQVVFYDQLGCGNSDRPGDPSLWSVNLFVEEVGVVREELSLDRIHLLGNSWGGMLAMEYALTRPEGLASLVLGGSPINMPQFDAEWARLRGELPPEVKETLRKHEEAGTKGDPAYEEAMLVFYRRHLCRLDPWPDYMRRIFGHFSGLGSGWGSTADPTLLEWWRRDMQDWDIAERLGEIRLPTLITSGRYDWVTPAIAEQTHRTIRGSEWVLFEKSAHFPHAEEPERYRQVLDRFLTRVESETAR